MIKPLRSIVFRREISLFGNHTGPRSWQKVDSPTIDTDWHEWELSIDTEMREVIIKRLKVAKFSPIAGRTFHIPYDAESVSAYELMIENSIDMKEIVREQNERNAMFNANANQGLLAREQELTQPIRVTAPKAPEKKGK